MSLHIFAAFVTPFGTASNNRGENEGNMTTLQKLIWCGLPHTTVSAEAIRFALRRRLAEAEPKGTNRRWEEVERVNTWRDPEFSGWATREGDTFIDDDLLGFMTAEAAREEAEATGEPAEPPSRGKGKAKGGKANVRRAVLEVTRAVSLTPWPGDTTFNAASPGATPSAQKKGKNPVPYGTEVHATRYQYGIALTPERLHPKTRNSRAVIAIEELCRIGPVAGNHGRFLFDFSPEAVVFRLTDDPAPRLLYCFDTKDEGQTVGMTSLLARVEAGDIDPRELVLGGTVVQHPQGVALRERGAVVAEQTGVLGAGREACRRIQARLEG